MLEPTDVEKIRAKQDEFLQLLKDLSQKEITTKNADTATQLAIMVNQQATASATFEIAVQLAELNSKLRRCMTTDDGINVRSI